MPFRRSSRSWPGTAFARLRAVRRFLLLALLAVLPLQLSWAAVAVYCQHEAETPAQARHFGHHEHHHDHAASTHAERSPVDVESKKADAAKALGATDPDCGHCHGACASLPGPRSALIFSLPVSEAPADTTRAIAPRAVAPPDRPQWARLA